MEATGASTETIRITPDYEALLVQFKAAAAADARQVINSGSDEALSVAQRLVHSLTICVMALASAEALDELRGDMHQLSARLTHEMQVRDGLIVCTAEEPCGNQYCNRCARSPRP